MGLSALERVDRRGRTYARFLDDTVHRISQLRLPRRTVGQTLCDWGCALLPHPTHAAYEVKVPPPLVTRVLLWVPAQILRDYDPARDGRVALDILRVASGLKKAPNSRLIVHDEN